MLLERRQLPVAANATELARRLRCRPGFAWLSSSDGSGPSYLACDPVAWSEAMDPEPQLALRLEGPPEPIPRWIGLLPYEAFRDKERPSQGSDPRPAPHHAMPQWARYAAVARITQRVELFGDDPAALDHLASLLVREPADATQGRLELESEQELAEIHTQRVARALELIAKGELYVINLARRFQCRTEGDAWALLACMSERASAPYSIALDWRGVRVAASSPELFLHLGTTGIVTTRPIKGTRPRGRNASEDRALLRALANDPKERAELTMVIDVERNDLGRLARPGSVRVVHAGVVETHGPVHHRVATIEATLEPNASREQLLATTLPSGSVTGAPKVRAMEVIAELEAQRRGLYTGAYGYLAHDGSLTLAMAIRCLTSVDGVGHYHAGGGIVADSSPRQEVAETLWKAHQVQGSAALRHWSGSS